MVSGWDWCSGVYNGVFHANILFYFCGLYLRQLTYGQLFFIPRVGGALAQSCLVAECHLFDHSFLFPLQFSLFFSKARVGIFTAKKIDVCEWAHCYVKELRGAVRYRSALFEESLLHCCGDLWRTLAKSSDFLLTPKNWSQVLDCCAPGSHVMELKSTLFLLFSFTFLLCA